METFQLLEQLEQAVENLDSNSIHALARTNGSLEKAVACNNEKLVNRFKEDILQVIRFLHRAKVLFKILGLKFSLSKVWQSVDIGYLTDLFEHFLQVIPTMRHRLEMRLSSGLRLPLDIKNEVESVIEESRLAEARVKECEEFCHIYGQNHPFPISPSAPGFRVTLPEETSKQVVSRHHASSDSILFAPTLVAKHGFVKNGPDF